MQTPILIGVNGRYRSGKDEFYYALRDTLRLQAQRLAFGDAMKAELAAAVGVQVTDIDRDKERYRGGLQWWADFRRHQHPQYWVRFVRSRWQQLCQRQNPPLVVVITDIRDIPEARFVRDHGGILVRIVRPLPWPERLRIWWEHPSIPRHRTETATDKFQVDFTIVNDGGVRDLREKVQIFWETLHTNPMTFSSPP